MSQHWVINAETQEATCVRCGQVFPAIKANHKCLDSEEILEGPGYIRRLVNFISASANHIKNGLPRCTTEELERRISICHTCPLFKPSATRPEQGRCLHEKCGCPINNRTFLSKAAWLDGHCPLDEPRW